MASPICAAAASTIDVLDVDKANARRRRQRTPLRRTLNAASPVVAQHAQCAINARPHVGIGACTAVALTAGACKGQHHRRLPGPNLRCSPLSLLSCFTAVNQPPCS